MLKDVRLWNRAQSAGIARKEVCLLGAGWDLAKDVTDRAELCVSELVGNAVRHAPGLPGSTLRLRLVRRADRLRLELYDGNRELPHAVCLDLHSESGRGPYLIAWTADDHGIELTTPDKAVWAERRLALRADRRTVRTG
jgi:histidine kinase-like protein